MTKYFGSVVRLGIVQEYTDRQHVERELICWILAQLFQMDGGSFIRI